MKKICFKCGKELPIESFYKHAQMKDGYLGKCKDCCKSDIKGNYLKNRDHYVQYEKERSQRPERKQKAAEYQRRIRANNPKKYKATSSLNNALRDGRIKKEPCAICGDDNSQAHHIDYERQGLNVIWLCKNHHMQIHGKITD